MIGTAITLVAFDALTHPRDGSDGVVVQMMAAVVGLLIGCVVLRAAMRCLIAARDWIAGKTTP